jgi:hypothetical protein
VMVDGLLRRGGCLGSGFGLARGGQWWKGWEREL